MSLLAQFERVTRVRPCPICERPDWCLVGRSGSEFEGDSICQRVESDKRYGDAGYLHRNSGKSSKRGPIRRFIAMLREPEGPSLTSVAVCATAWAQPFERQVLAARLGVSSESLCRLAIGFVNSGTAAQFGIRWAEGAWTFPMCGAEERVVGVRLRMPDGSKRAVPGGHEGLFIPKDLGVLEQLLICEGPTDTAAMLDLGFAAIGRPSCNGGRHELIRFIRRVKPRSVVILADNDDAGQSGAQALARALITHAPALHVISPPGQVKDAREWKRSGATAHDVVTVIAAAQPLRLSIQARWFPSSLKRRS